MPVHSYIKHDRFGIFVPTFSPTEDFLEYCLQVAKEEYVSNSNIACLTWQRSYEVHDEEDDKCTLKDQTNWDSEDERLQFTLEEFRENVIGALTTSSFIQILHESRTYNYAMAKF